MKKQLVRCFGFALSACILFSMTACAGQGNSPQGSGSSSQPSSSSDAGGSSSAAGGVQGKITYASNRTDLDEFFTKVKKDFSDKNPGAEVEIETIQDYQQVMNIRLSSNDAPDVLYLNTNSISSYPDFYEPLDDLGYTSDSIYFYDSPKGMFQGKHYGLNEAMSVTGILANKKTLESCGVTEIPKTKDELYAALDKIKEKGLTPMGSMVKTAWPLVSWETLPNANFKGSYDDHVQKCIDEKKFFLEDSPYQDMFQLIGEMKGNGYFDQDLIASDWDVLRINMDTVGMIFLASYGIGALDGTAKEDVVFFPFPFDNSGKGLSMSTPDQFMACNKSSENKETAKAFIKYWLEESGFADTIGSVPSVKSVVSTNKALSEFMAMEPEIVEQQQVADEELLLKWNEIRNTAQFGVPDVSVAVFLSEDGYESVIDSYNAKFADAIDVVGTK